MNFESYAEIMKVLREVGSKCLNKKIVQKDHKLKIPKWKWQM